MVAKFESLQSKRFEWLKVSVVAGGCFAAGKLGLSMAFEDTNASPVWPSTGLALAVVILWGYRVWPGIFIGAFLANVVTYVANGIPVSTSVLTSCSIGVGNTLEAVTGVFLLRRFVASNDPLDRAQDVFRFIVLAAMFATTVSAMVGVTSICAAGIADWANIGYLWWTWWVGDAAGALVVAPFLLAWFKERSICWQPRRLAEAGLLFALLVLVSFLVFGVAGRPGSPVAHGLEYLTVPIIVWATFRFGQRGATTSVLLVGIIAVWCTVRGLGPFVTESSNDSLLLLQVYLGVLAVTALTLAGVLAERKQTEEVLRRTVRLASLGTLAAGIAHEINTPLGTIVLRAETALQLISRPDSDEALARSLKTIQDAAMSCGRITKSILQFARAGQADKWPGNLGKVAKHARNAVIRFAEEAQVDVRLAISDDLPNLAMNPTGMEQVLVNLISNAVQATEPGGTVSVRIEPMAESIQVIVEDHGCGMTAEQVRRVFDPFYTTRMHGEGTGLGMSITHSIVEEHGGTIEVQSSPEEGTTVTVILPVNPPATAEAEPDESSNGDNN